MIFFLSSYQKEPAILRINWANLEKSKTKQNEFKNIVVV